MNPRDKESSGQPGSSVRGFKNRTLEGARLTECEGRGTLSMVLKREPLKRSLFSLLQLLRCYWTDFGKVNYARATSMSLKAIRFALGFYIRSKI